MNIWVAAMDSSSIIDLAYNLRYGGHGLLWPLSVYLLSQIAPYPLAMQLLHVAIATASIWLLFRFSPLSRWKTLLIGFGYYLCFEYVIISRHYALGVLCMLTSLVCMTSFRQPRYAPAALALALLMQTTVYGFILSVALSAAWCVSLWKDPVNRKISTSDSTVLIFAAALLIASMAAAAISFQPPADGGFHPYWHWTFDLKLAIKTFATLWRAFVPIPIQGIRFWNSNILDPTHWFTGLLGLFIALFAFWQFRKSLKALTCWAVGAGGLLLFSYVKYYGYQRHHGHLFLAFLAASWLMASEKKRRDLEHSDIVERTGLISNALVCTVLIVQLLVGLYASIMDLVYPFSASQAMAAYIRDNGLDNNLIVADTDYATLPVVGRLDNPLVYYPRCERVQRMIFWDKHRYRPFKEQDFLDAVEKIGVQSSVPVLALTNYSLTKIPNFLKPLKHLDAGIVPDEHYDLFRVSKKDIETKLDKQQFMSN